MRTLGRQVGKANLLLVTLLFSVSADARNIPRLYQKQQKPGDSLSEYIARVKSTVLASPAPGSLWSPDSPFADLASDYKARRLNDVVIVNIVEQTSSTSNGAIKSARNFSASSGLTGLFGQLKASNALQNLASPSSTNNLSGQAQASSSSTLQTTISGSVVGVLPNGYLVIEAQRKEAVDNQQQTLTLRGVIRPGDLASDDSVNSTSISNLEILLNGHGVISDGTRPPNKVINTILKLLEF